MHTQKDRLTPLLGLCTGLVFLLSSYFIWNSPPDKNQGDLVRIMYIHVPTAWIAYLSFGMTAFWGLGYLFKNDRKFDRLSMASAEIGVLTTFLAIVGGMLWARPTFGVYWTWEPRLTTTALMFLVFIGYFIVRGLIEDPHRRTQVAAVIGIVGSLSVPINYMSVAWWNSLHQGFTVQLLGKTQVSADTQMQWALYSSTLAFTLLYMYFLRLRATLARRIDSQEERDLERERQFAQGGS